MPGLLNFKDNRCYFVRMQETIIIQGRPTSPGDMELVRQLIDSNASWHRTRLSKELCDLWNWRADNGQPKDMAARSFLLKLETKGLIVLPEKRVNSGGSGKGKQIADVPH